MDRFLFERLAIADVIRVTPRRFGDERGYFAETYAFAPYAEAGIEAVFVQDNQSLSTRRWTVRGLHFQRPPAAQAKLVRVVAGSAFDVAVDIRRDSPTFGRWCASVLTAEGGEQLYVPRGFAHGFCTLEANTVISYKVDDYYVPSLDDGIAWNSPALAIDWPVSATDAVLSDKDRGLPGFQSFHSPFIQN